MSRFLTLFLLFCSGVHAEITALYLSWYSDPSTTMTVQWHTLVDEPSDSLFILSNQKKWIEYHGEHHFLDDLAIHAIQLVNLLPNTEYTFRVGLDAKIYKFRTAPATLDESIRFVIGGDVCCNKKLFHRMNQTVIQYDPLFAVLGGDIAYAIYTAPFRTASAPLRRWLSFLEDWKNEMITEDGRVIPFVLVPGNHDIEPDNYELFFNLFAFPKKQLYRTLQFGDYLNLFLLDTGHFQPIEGRQALWLDQALSASTTTPYRFAVYHHAAYPSYYPYHSTIAKKVRTYWTPLFEKYKLQAAFENHNHAYKRTYPIKANQVSEDGVVYLGDGSWGASPRKTNEAWYLNKKARKNSVFIVELSTTQAKIQAIDLLNTLLDELIFQNVSK